jgi:SAM-dependent methyltransferase
MREGSRERIPAYVPAAYRVFLKIRKVIRQTTVRIQEALHARHWTQAQEDTEEEKVRPVEPVPAQNPPAVLNKCAQWIQEDLDSLRVKVAAQELLSLKTKLTGRNLRFTNSSGAFLARQYDPVSEQRKLWENSWLIAHAQPAPGQRVLDLGGASSLFSFYLAQLGCKVQVVDNDWNNCAVVYNAGYVAEQMDWDLRALDRDLSRPLPFARDHFDRVFCVCVLEHLPSRLRQFVMREVGRVLKPGGLAGLTIDYDIQRPVRFTDKGLRFAYRQKIERDLIRPSGLRIHGNADWVDACPPSQFLGAFFLKKNG